MKKISILKAETFESIVEKVKTAPDADVVLRIPKGSIVTENSKYLRTLKKELKGAGKNLSIESVDDAVLEFASQAGIEAFNPFFSKTNQFSDIVPKGQSRAMREVVSKPVKKSVPKPIDRALPSKPESKEASPEEEEVQVIIQGDEYHEPRRFPIRALLFILGFVTIVVGGIVLWTSFASATITITRETVPWSYSGTVTVDPRIKDVALAGLKIPGESFALKNTFESRFPASGTKDAEEKARGVIRIYNAYSTASQFLIKNTRFQTPDGKIFRLIDNVTVPPGKMVSGKFTPSSIDAKVIADKAGEAYNIPATPKFTIPGFAGTPKFTGFYGVSTGAMTGGFIGTVTYPTSEELVKAEAEFAKTSEAALADKLLRQVPEELIMVEGARSFRFLTKTVDTFAGGDKKFGIKGEGELRIVAFKESDLTVLLSKLGANAVGSEKELLDSSTSRGKGQLAIGSSSVLTFPVSVASLFVEHFDVASLQKLFAGKTQEEIGQLQIAGMKGSPEVSVRPFWIRRVPKNPERVSVNFR